MLRVPDGYDSSPQSKEDVIERHDLLVIRSVTTIIDSTNPTKVRSETPSSTPIPPTPAVNQRSFRDIALLPPKLTFLMATFCPVGL
jgi:hypothetical protein